MKDRIPYFERLGDALQAAALRESPRKKPGRPSSIQRRALYALGLVLGVMCVAGIGAVVFDDEGERGPSLEAATDRAPDERVSEPASRAWWPSSPNSGGGVLELERYESLKSLVDTSGIVAVGVVTDAGPGRIVNEKDLAGGGAARYLKVVLSITQPIAAADGIAPPETVTLEFGPYDMEVDLDKVGSTLVGDEALYFLRQKGSGIPAYGVEADDEELALGVFRVVSSQGLYLNDAGVARAPWSDSSSPEFVRELDGLAFEAVVGRVEERVPADSSV